MELTSRIYRVNMTDLKVMEEPVPEKYQLLGGRALTDTILLDEVDPKCHPLGPKNKLIVAPGLLAGTTAPSGGRCSVGGKSPLTGGIKESNSGGPGGHMLGKMLIKGIIIEGMPKDTAKWYVLKVTPKGVEILDAPKEIIGEGTYKTAEVLRSQHGKVNVMAIGQAGENLSAAACISVTNMEGDPSRNFGRGGMGALMGSKHIKAIMIDNENTSAVSYADQEKFKTTAKTFAKSLIESKKSLTEYGTAVLVTPVQKVGGLPTKNYRQGQWENYEKITGQAIAKMTQEHGGKMSHACHPGCVIRCSNVIKTPEGKYLTGSLEFETVALFGSNCLIDDLQTIAQCDRMCDDFGVDTIETAMCAGLAMEAGLMEWSDKEALVNFVAEIGKGSPLGRLIACGASTFGKVYGLWRVAATKGQATAAYDTRAMKGTGATYVVSTMGGDHTVGNALPGRGGLEPGCPDRQASLSRILQVWSASICDAMGFCLFIGPQKENAPIVADLVNARYGVNWTLNDVKNLGQEIIETEVKFNRAAGLPDIDIPEFFTVEPVPPFDYVFDVPNTDLQKIHNFGEEFEDPVEF